MEKFIPYEKLSKKRRRELDQLCRKDWGALDPVTRRPDDPKAYNRNKARRWNDNSPISEPYFFQLFATLSV